MSSLAFCSFNRIDRACNRKFNFTSGFCCCCFRWIFSCNPVADALTRTALNRVHKLRHNSTSTGGRRLPSRQTAALVRYLQCFVKCVPKIPQPILTTIFLFVFIHFPTQLPNPPVSFGKAWRRSYRCRLMPAMPVKRPRYTRIPKHRSATPTSQIPASALNKSIWSPRC